MIRALTCSMLAALLAGAPAALAQGPGPAMPPMGAAPSGPELEFQKLQLELQQIDQQLAATQQKAIATDASLSASQTAISDKIEAQMEATHGEKLKRLDELKAKVDATVATGAPPSPEVQGLLMEGQMLAMELQEAQAQVMQSEPLATEIKAFEETMTAAMKKADPGTDALLARRTQLIESLMALTSPQQGPGPGMP